jgi:hypothetical protein
LLDTAGKILTSTIWGSIFAGKQGVCVCVLKESKGKTTWSQAMRRPSDSEIFALILSGWNDPVHQHLGVHF